MFVICADLLLSQQMGPTWNVLYISLRVFLSSHLLRKKRRFFCFVLFSYCGCKIKVSVTTLRFTSNWRSRWHLEVLTPLPPPCFSPHFLSCLPGHPWKSLPKSNKCFPSSLTNPNPHFSRELPNTFWVSASLQIKTFHSKLHRKIKSPNGDDSKNWWHSI